MTRTPMTKLIPLGQASPEALALTHALSFTRPWAAKDLVELINGLGALGVAAEAEDGSVDGFVLIRALAGDAEILTLCVAPHARLLGIGKSLVQAALGLAGGAGAEELWLEVADYNAAAIALYSGEGFEQSGKRNGYYRRDDGSAIDALVLKRRLNSSPS